MPQALLRAARPALVLALLAGASIWIQPGAAAAQAASRPSRARLQGVIVDEATHQPVESAEVSIGDAGQRLITGRWGSFEFPDAPLGLVTVHVSASGHPSVAQDVEVRNGRVVFVRIVLPSVAAVLSEILARARGAEVPSGPARTAADLLALQAPRTRVNTGEVGKSDYQLRLRQAASFQGSTAPVIVLDGAVLSQGPDAFEALERIPAADVEAIEVLSGPASAFLYPWAANGVIRVTTKRGIAPN